MVDAAAEPIPAELGSLGVVHLRRLWSRTVARGAGTLRVPDDPLEWTEHDVLIRGLHLNLLETFELLYRSPSFEEFEAWILERNGGSIEPGRIARINAALAGRPADDALAAGEPVFGPDELAFWDEHGYVVLHDAVTPAQCSATEDAIWSFLQMDRNDPKTWYRDPHGHSIWVPLRDHPALWANRSSPRVRRAFVQLWNRADLWMTVDQVGFNPPERPNWKFPGPHLHWDVSLARPIPFGVQGLLYLVDVAPNQGAFTCVPGFHRRIDAWLESLPAAADPRRADLAALGAVPIGGRAGDLIMWHHALPHGSSPNRAALPRIVQYLQMQPARYEQRTDWR